MKALNQRKNQIEEDIEKEKKYKLLFTGTGEPLRIMVGEVFQQIGFDVDFQDSYEEDLNIRHHDKRILVEVSGVNKGLKYDKLIRHHGRIETEKGKDDTVLKGLVVVNTFKDTRLDERAGKTQFSEGNIIPYSNQNEICIMSGLTLLNLYLKNSLGKISADEIFQLICNTNGVLEIEDNYITKTE
ncbi:MAG: hypothetical protein AAGU32_11120 [Bacillota bacterium]